MVLLLTVKLALALSNPLTFISVMEVSFPTMVHKQVMVKSGKMLVM